MRVRLPPLFTTLLPALPSRAACSGDAPGGDAAPGGQGGSGAGGACAGRRPEGLAPLGGEGARSAGAFFARMAYLEAASVEAFLRLHDELSEHEAPFDLRDDCQTSAADEVRHAEAMAALAERFGEQAEEPVIAPARRRDLLALALENAVEGCVRETYGALEASFQAEHAGDEQVREVMATVARDETAHAALSWRLHAWLEDQLDEATWTGVEAAMRGAVAELRRELDQERDDEFLRITGLPDRETALLLLDGLSTNLWRDELREAA